VKPNIIIFQKFHQVCAITSGKNNQIATIQKAAGLKTCLFLTKIKFFDKIQTKLTNAINKSDEPGLITKATKNHVIKAVSSR
jgi:hypothetical protein